MNQLAQEVNFGGYSVQGPVQTGGAFSLANATIGAIISAAVPYVFAFAGIGLLLMIISSGFTMMMSAGDAKKLEAGRGRLTQSIIGFLIIFAAYWIVQMIGIIFGWDESIGNTFR